MDSANWASVQNYIVWDLCCMPLLLNVQHVVFRFVVDCLTLLVMNSLMTQWELKEEELDSKLVCFGVDGVSAFQGFKFGLTIQVQC
jgi:hypothetical protein